MLNISQQKAVETTEGPVIVIAGPGSGKTQVLTDRIIHLLKDTDTKPNEILCLTYTEAGATNMKARIEKKLDNIKIDDLKIFTFHGFCDHILSNPHYSQYFDIDIKNLNIATDLDKVKIINDIFLNHDFPTLLGDSAENINTGRILSKIAQIKRDCITTEDLKTYLETFQDKLDKLLEKNKYTSISHFRKTKKQDRKGVSTIPKAYKNYKKLSEFIDLFEIYNSGLRERKLIDFEDMITIVVEKFENDKHFLGIIAEKLKYILIDEFQDTNEPQNRIANLIVEYWEEIGNGKNIFVVGDDDQSIYSFQGAIADNFQTFLDIYPEAKIIILDTNYRSIQDVIDVSRSLMKDVNKFNKEYISGKIANEAKNDITGCKLLTFGTYEDEVNYLIETINREVTDGASYGDFGIIYPKNKIGLALAQELDAKNIKYSMKNGDDILFFDKTGYIIDLLNIISDKNANIARYSLLELGINLNDINVDALAKKLNSILDRDSLFNVNIDDINLEFFKKLKDICSQIFNLEDYKEHIESLFDKLNIFFKQTTIVSLESFIEDIEILRKNNITLVKSDLDMSPDCVKLTTAHSAKGLEFKYVFIVGFSKYDWEYSRDQDLFKLAETTDEMKDEKLNERRRLLYVAMTRAEESLYLLNYLQDEKKTTKLLGEIGIEKVAIESSSSRILTEYEPNANYSEMNNKEGMKNESLQLPPDLKLSPTSMNDYLECPYRYKLKYILKIRDQELDFIFGNPIHAALESFWKKYKESSSIPTLDELLIFWQVALEKDIRFKKLPMMLQNKQREKGIDLLNIYHETYMERGLFQTPYLVEAFLGYQGNNLYLDEVPIQGKIDRVELDEQNNLTIVDNKTGNQKSTEKILAAEDIQGMKYKNQLLFYKLLLEANDEIKNRYIVKTLRLDFIEPDENKDIEIADMSSVIEEFEEFKLIVKDVWQNILAKRFHRTTNFNVCEYCDYKSHCWPSGKIGYRK